MSQQQPGVLLTRLVPPRLPSRCLPRTSLVARVRAALDRRMVAILAGAGYGKSTLLALTLQSLDGAYVWCTLDARIRDSRSLLAHIAAGLGQVVPGFGSELDLSGPPESQAASLANEMAETIVDDIVLALDDVHLLTPGAGEGLRLLVDDLPQNAHFACAGRAPLPFGFARLRAGGLAEFDEADLALEFEETETLLSSEDSATSSDEATRVHRATEGWVSGVVLAAGVGSVAVKGGARFDTGALFDYLAEEVVAAQPPEVRGFLEETAILDRFTPALASSLTGRDDADEVCRHLIDNHLFTAQLGSGGEWYRYHNLFQAFLRRRSEATGEDRLLHRRAAGAWEEAGEPVEAARHWVAAGEPEAAVRLIEPIAEEMLAGPEAGTLASLLEEIPEPLWSDSPSLVLAHAILLFHQGRLEDAFSALARAMEQLIAAGEHERAATAYLQLISLQMVMGTPQERGVRVGQRWLDEIDPTTPTLALGVIMMASEQGCACDYEGAAAGLSHALSLPGADASPVGAAAVQTMRALFVDHPSGRSEEAMEAMGRAIAVLEDHGEDDQLGFIVLALILRALVQNHLGRFEGALADAQRATEISERLGAGAGYGRVLTKLRAVALAGLGRWSDLEDELAGAEPAERLLGSNYAFRLAAPAARLAAHRRDAPEVERQVAFARRAVAAYGFSFDTPTWLCDLAEAAVDVDLIEVARELHSEATHAAERARTPWSRTRADLVGAMAWVGEERSNGLLSSALGRTQEHGYVGIWAERDRPYAGPLLAHAIAAELGPAGFAEDLLARCGGEVLDEAAEVLFDAPLHARLALARAVGRSAEPSPPLLDQLLRDRSADVRDAAREAWARLRRRPRAALDIRALGRLRVRRDGIEVPASAFGRQRARQLLGLLIAAQGPVHREMAVAELWPDSEPARGLAALRTTLHALRRALQPEIEPNDAASVIASEGEMLSLDLGPRDRLDLADFQATCEPVPDEASEAKIVRMRESERLYHGPFLAEWPYEEWAEGRRRELAEAFQRVLADAADVHLERGEPMDAVFVLRRLVEMDPQAEAWHRDLMRAYALQGDRGRALRQFHACRTILRRDLGVEPSAPTREVYLEILQGSGALDRSARAAAVE